MSEQRNSDGSNDGGGTSNSTGYEEVEYVEEIVYEEVEEEAEEDHAEESVNKERAGQFEPSSKAATPLVSPSDASRSNPETQVQSPSASQSSAEAPKPAAQPNEIAAAEPLLGASGSTLGTAEFGAIGEQAAKVAGEVQHVAAEMQHVAAEVTKKLQSTLFSAFTGSTSHTPDGTAATAAAAAPGSPIAGLTGLTGRLSQWWSNIDQQLASNNAGAEDAVAQRMARCSAADPELVRLFNLSPGEHLVEQYNCQLLQTYGCNHNQLTPSMQILFPGTLYITDLSTCFQADPCPATESSLYDTQGAVTKGSSSSTSAPATSVASSSNSDNSGAADVPSQGGGRVWFKLPHKSVLSTSHVPGTMKKVGADVLRVEVDGHLATYGSSSISGEHDSAGGGKGATLAVAAGEYQGITRRELRWSVQFTEFAPASGLDGALALIEHLRESVASQA